MKTLFLKRVTLIAVLIGFFYIDKMNAQNIDDAFATISDSSGQTNFFTVIVSDTLNISEIELRLGNELSASDMMMHSFVFDSQPSSPYSYLRTGNRIKIGIGIVTATDMFYGEARLKYSNGSWSSPFQFISN